MTQPKDTIFFAHSFEKEKPSWSDKTDAEVAAWFQRLLQRRWKVLSGKVPEARPIADKIIEGVSESKAMISLFTRRHKVEGTDNYLPSPWLLCECSYAQAFFRHHGFHAVAGFRERGVDPDSLAMLSVSGMEFPEFDRDNLERDKQIFNKYLDDLERRIHAGPSAQSLLEPDIYAQTTLHKIYLIYRNGFGTVHNIVDIVIKDAERFMVELQGRIPHRIWTHFGEIPALSEMLRVPIHKRKNEPFLHGILDTHKNEPIGTSLDFSEEKRRSSSVQFWIRFLDASRQPLKVKANDTLRYQYAWGIPGMFKVNEEDLQPPVGSAIDAKTYCLAELDANYGPIERVRLELRFEREARDGLTRQLFSKRPFVRFGQGHVKDSVWGQPHEVKVLTGDPDEFDMWYERFVVNEKNLAKRVQVAWRPSSKKNEL